MKDHHCIGEPDAEMLLCGLDGISPATLCFSIQLPHGPAMQKLLEERASSLELRPRLFFH